MCEAVLRSTSKRGPPESPPIVARQNHSGRRACLHYGVRVTDGCWGSLSFQGCSVISSRWWVRGALKVLCVCLLSISPSPSVTLFSISARSRRRRVRRDLRHEVTTIYLSSLPWSYSTVRRRDRSPASVRAQGPGATSPKKEDTKKGRSTGLQAGPSKRIE